MYEFNQFSKLECKELGKSSCKFEQDFSTLHKKKEEWKFDFVFFTVN